MEYRRVYLTNDLELFIMEFKKRIHILVFSHYDWGIENYQILKKEKIYVPGWSKRCLFEGGNR